MAEYPAGVRRFEASDREAVRTLHRRALRAAGTDPADVPGTDDLRSVRETYVESGGEFLVVERDGEVVAMGGLRVDTPACEEREGEVGELLRMRVDPDHQREGYGTAVLGALETAARERGLDRLTLTTARRQTAATEFYPANGYERVGTEAHGEYELLRFEKSLDS
ncbi:MAG: GNAT family N-acetyltransferase [Haloarculaceae archaeon]